MSRWIQWIKEFAKKHNKSYGGALSDPECSASYRRKYKDIGKTKGSGVCQSCQKAVPPPEEEEEDEVVRMQRLMNTLPPELNKNIQEFMPESTPKLKREPEKDAIARNAIQELIIELNRKNEDEKPYNAKIRRQTIYPKIFQLLKKIVVKTPVERQQIDAWNTGHEGVFKSYFYR